MSSPTAFRRNRWQKVSLEAGKVVDTPWSLAAGNDLTEAKGERSFGVRFVNWYVAHLHRAAQSDPMCSLAFHRVANLLDPPAGLMNPSVALRVFKASRARREARDPHKS